MRRADDAVDVLLGRQRHRARDLRARTRHRVDDLARRAVDDLVVVGLEPDADLLSRHGFASFLLFVPLRAADRLRGPVCRGLVRPPRSGVSRPSRSGGRTVAIRTLVAARWRRCARRARLDGRSSAPKASRARPSGRATRHSMPQVRAAMANPRMRPESSSLRSRRCYLMILVTRPAPTVRPPSRMAKRRPSSMAIGWISVDRHLGVVARHDHLGALGQRRRRR